MDVGAAMVRFVLGHGVLVEQPVMLRSTNNVVAWPAPSDVVAKISDGSQRLPDELAVALALQSLEADCFSAISPSYGQLAPDRPSDIRARYRELRESGIAGYSTARR